MASKFYEQVATPEPTLRQSAPPSGPDVDIDARSDINRRQQNSLGSALNSLLGITAAATDISTIQDRGEYSKMKAEHDLDANNDVRESASYIQTYIDNKDASKKIVDYNNDELIKLTTEATEKYISDNKLGDKPYFRIIREKLNEKNNAFLDKQNTINEEYLKNKRYDVLVEEASTLFKSLDDTNDLAKEISDLTKKHVGLNPVTIDENGEMVSYTPSIKDTKQNASLRILQRIMHDAVGSRDYTAVQKLKSKEMRELFDMPDYDNVIQVIEKQTTSKLNEVRQLTRDKLEEQVYLGIQSNGFKSAKEVDDWFSEQLASIRKEDRPNTRDLLQLKEGAKKAIEDQLAYERVYATVKGGDYTFMDRTNMKKAEKDLFNNKMFMDETGISDLSPDTIESAVLSGDRDMSIKSFFNNFGKAPPALKLYGSTAPSGGINSLKKKRNVFANMSVLSQGTPVSLEDIYSPEEMTRMNYVGRLLDDAEDGVISEAEVSQAYRNFSNDIKKNTDSFGNYVSPKAMEFLNTDDTQEWLTENVKDASWTTDEFSAQAYRRRQFTHYFSLAMENTDDPDVARDKAERMFRARHRDVEAPNGEETVLPDEYMEYDVKDFLKIANHHQDFKPFKHLGYLGTGIGSSAYFDRSISFTPDANYEKNKVMNLYYGEGDTKRLVMSVTPKKFETILNEINDRIVFEARKRRQERLSQVKQ